MINIPNAVNDESQIDDRDYLLGSEQVIELGGQNRLYTLDELPNEFNTDDQLFKKYLGMEGVEIPNQYKKGYYMSCTAQSTSTASNMAKRIKRNDNIFSGFVLRDIAVKEGIGSDSGANLKAVINLAKNNKVIKGYYRVTTLEEILSAIYNTDFVVTGSNTIDWSKTKDGLVKEVSSGAGHAFALIGWDKDKQIGEYKGAIRCVNSYGKDYQDGGCFWIPFDLIKNGLFAITKEAILV